MNLLQSLANSEMRVVFKFISRLIVQKVTIHDQVTRYEYLDTLHIF